MPEPPPPESMPNVSWEILQIEPAQGPRPLPRQPARQVTPRPLQGSPPRPCPEHPITDNDGSCATHPRAEPFMTSWSTFTAQRQGMNTQFFPHPGGNAQTPTV